MQINILNGLIQINKYKNYNKYHFIFNNIDKNKKLKKSILKKYKNYSPRLSDVIVIFGGDGFMLETLKKYQKYKKPFYGINKGSFGFLMNKFKKNDIKKNYQSIAEPIPTTIATSNSIT